jgi:eukaryotic-like serine/threonine-protein kinase
MEASDPSPRIVGRYRIHGPIASGGMATVHIGRRTEDTGVVRTVAIKCPHPQYAEDPEFAAMFLDEARLAGSVLHPNVVSVIDVVFAEDELFLAMEYVPGASLAEMGRALRTGDERLAPAVTARIVGDVLEGLHAAHEARSETGAELKLVHRDVSPQNIHVGVDGVTRLLDFGVAKAVGRLQTTRGGKIKGKMAYMAPEQITGKRVTRRTDLYAASVVLWEALTGRRLFADAREQILDKVLLDRVPPPSEVISELSPDLDRVVLRGLTRDPQERPETALQMAAELRQCVHPAPHRAVAAYVRSLAGKAIDETAARIAAIERAEETTSHTRRG